MTTMGTMMTGTISSTSMVAVSIHAVVPVSIGG